jgi:hypothetical protein
MRRDFVSGAPGDGNLQRTYHLQYSALMVSEKVVTPVKTGVQSFGNYSKTLDTGSPIIGRYDEIYDLDHRFGHIIMTAEFPPLKKGD